MQKVTKELLDSGIKGQFAIEDPEFNIKSENVNNKTFMPWLSN